MDAEQGLLEEDEGLVLHPSRDAENERDARYGLGHRRVIRS